jgi:tetratricopeptide (TPR) repeat protein
MWMTLSTLALATVLAGPSPQAAPVAKADAVTEQARKEALDHYRAGMQKMRAESFEEAAAEFEAAVKLDSLFVLAHYQLGEARMALKQYPAAVEALEACIAAHKQLVALQVTDRALAEKRLDEQIEVLKDALRGVNSPGTKEVQPQNEQLRLESQIHELELQRRRRTTATEVPAEFSLALGSAYLRSGRMADAERAYVDAIRANPKLGEAHNNLAFVYFRSGRLDQAESELAAAEKAGFPVNPRFKDDVRKAKKEAESKKP